MQHILPYLKYSRVTSKSNLELEREKKETERMIL